jgi:hypothetical protein
MTTYATGSALATKYATGAALAAQQMDSAFVENVRHGASTYKRQQDSVNGEQDKKEERRRARALERSERAQLGFDPGVLACAKELISDLDPDDQIALTVNLAEAGTVVASLWEYSQQVTPIHRQILAALDTAMLAALAAEKISAEQISAFLEAIGDLGMETVSEVQAEAIRSRLIDLGKKPLFIVGNAE